MEKNSKKNFRQRIIKRLGRKFLLWNNNFQSKHSLIPTTPKINNEVFDWTTMLERNWQDIRNELIVLLKNPQKIPSFHQISPDQKRISKGDSWKAFGLYIYGNKIEDNCALCPVTASVIGNIPAMRTAMFSILQPHYHIVPHKGPTRAVIRVHLGLIVPEGKEKLWIRVDDQYLHWEEGKVICFDDAYEHEVRNDTAQLRAVLFLDIERPMDRLGTLVNKVLFSLIKASPYIKKPLENISNWNRENR